MVGDVAQHSQFESASTAAQPGSEAGVQQGTLACLLGQHSFAFTRQQQSCESLQQPGDGIPNTDETTPASTAEIGFKMGRRKVMGWIPVKNSVYRQRYARGELSSSRITTVKRRNHNLRSNQPRGSRHRPIQMLVQERKRPFAIDRVRPVEPFDLASVRGQLQAGVV